MIPTLYMPPCPKSMASGQCPSSVYQRVSGEVKTHSVRSEKASAAMNELRGSTRSFLERKRHPT